MEALGVAALLIFGAEIGDKSQLFAFTVGARYRPALAMLAIAVAATAVQGLAVVAGVLLGEAVPRTPILLAAGVLFIGFAVWTVVGQKDSPYDDPGRTEDAPRFAFVAVAAAFFLSELGDRTMLATAALATEQNPVATWAGATLGMVAADGLAVWMGSAIGGRLNRRLVQWVAAVAFAAFGIALLVEAARSL